MMVAKPASSSRWPVARAGQDADGRVATSVRPERDGGRKPEFSGGRGDGPRPRGGRPSGPAARLFIGAGREAGIRPGDLVGAITGETGLTGKDVGSIEIHQRFALVEVPESAADEVVRALRATMIKGRKATVRRDRT